MLKRRTSRIFLTLIAVLAFAANANAATLNYSLDVSILHGSMFGLNAGDVYLNAGHLTIDSTSLAGFGTETASITNFHMALGTETWDWFPPPTIYNVPGYGIYPTLNIATFVDGVLDRIQISSLSSNDALLELDGNFTNGYFGSMSLLADSYYIGDVIGLYAAAQIPEPSAALLFGLGGLVVARRTRQR